MRVMFLDYFFKYFKDFINEIDRTKLRGLERSMHLCAAECCTDSIATVEDVHRCVEKCQVNNSVCSSINLPFQKTFWITI